MAWTAHLVYCDHQFYAILECAEIKKPTNRSINEQIRVEPPNLAEMADEKTGRNGPNVIKAA